MACKNRLSTAANADQQLHNEPERKRIKLMVK